MSDTLTKVDFTIDDVVQKVREVAAENPDHVYEGRPSGYGGTTCLYREGENREKPGCIVGQALDRLGYVVPETMEGSNVVSVLENVFETNLDQYGTSTDPEAIKARWLRSVQNRQDAGDPWGEAVEYADMYYPWAAR